MFLLWNINSDGLKPVALSNPHIKQYKALHCSGQVFWNHSCCLAVPCHIYFVHHRIWFVFCKVYAFSFPLGGTCKQWIQLLGIHNWSFKMHYMYIFKNHIKSFSDLLFPSQYIYVLKYKVFKINFYTTKNRISLNFQLKVEIWNWRTLLRGVIVKGCHAYHWTFKCKLKGNQTFTFC